jgi:polyphenol oxidase
MNIFPKNVNFISTKRYLDGGESLENFENFNLALHVNDNKKSVLANRSLLQDYHGLPSDPVWINQIHSSICVDASLAKKTIQADAIFTNTPRVVCSILTADCLPVFVSKKDGSIVGVAHAGWKGLISGVIENLIKSFHCNGCDLIVHLGPAISQSYFEVGAEIKDLYLSKNISFSRSFSFYKDKHYLDLYDAAKVILESFNITFISGGDRCTFRESDEFFSYRRDGISSGRMAHLIWIT